MTAALPTRATNSAATLVRIAIAALLLAAAVSIVGPISHPAQVEASTASDMEAYLIKWINDARASRGVPRLTVGTKLTTYAGDRAAKMASTNKLAHPSCLGCELNARDISWTVCAETIAATTYPYGYQAAKSLFNSWKGSSGHWSILMSRNYTRFGVGVAYRSSNRTTFAAAVLVRG
jgi:uncharacterized protein YkwD